MRAHQSGMSMERPNMSPDEPRNRKRGPPVGGGGESLSTNTIHITLGSKYLVSYCVAGCNIIITCSQDVRLICFSHCLIH